MVFWLSVKPWTGPNPSYLEYSGVDSRHRMTHFHLSQPRTGRVEIRPPRSHGRNLDQMKEKGLMMTRQATRPVSHPGPSWISSKWVK